MCVIVNVLGCVFAPVDFPFMSGCRANAEGSILREDVVTVPARHFPPQRKVCVTECVHFSTHCYFFITKGNLTLLFRNRVTKMLRN